MTIHIGHVCLTGVGRYRGPAASWWTRWCSRFWSVDQETCRCCQCPTVCEFILSHIQIFISFLGDVVSLCRPGIITFNFTSNSRKLASWSHCYAETADCIATWRATKSCLFGLAVECANARLSTWPGLVSCTELGTNPTWRAKIRSGAYVIGLIFWAASEGSTVSSLICDHWLTHKVRPDVVDCWSWTFLQACISCFPSHQCQSTEGSSAVVMAKWSV